MYEYKETDYDKIRKGDGTRTDNERYSLRKFRIRNKTKNLILARRFRC